MSMKLKLRCPNWIKVRYTPKAHERRANKKASIYCWDYQARFGMRPGAGKHERCNGNLTVTVDIEEEPDWGCTRSVLSVKVKCDTCGEAFVQPPDVTTEDWIESLVAEALDNKTYT